VPSEGRRKLDATIGVLHFFHVPPTELADGFGLRK
jgi:hypothetical protein